MIESITIATTKNKCIKVLRDFTMATRVIVKKIKTLTEFLLSMKAGETVEIPEREYRCAHVRSCVSRLRKNKGVTFFCTQAGMPEGCKVTRMN